jgi:tRNA(fMet)-specific endonuclease VapC
LYVPNLSVLHPQTPHDEVAICAVVGAELYHGATKYVHPTKRASVLHGFLAPFDSLPFDSTCVTYYARIREYLELHGQIIGGNDLMIAAIALAHDLKVVTHNGG